MYSQFSTEDLSKKKKVFSKPTKFWGYIRNGTLLFFCFVCIVTSICLAYFWLPAKVNYHVIERYIFSAKNEKADVNLGVIIPQNGPYQKIDNLLITWSGTQSIESDDALDILKLSGVVTNYETIEAIIEYDVTLSQGKIIWKGPIQEFQTLPQKGIESDCQTLVDKAAQIRVSTNKDVAYSIYKFTSQYLTYSLEYKDCTNNSALTTYEIGSCVCMGFARLMVALNRASGIPAQMMIGYLYPDPIFSHPNETEITNRLGEAHAWVEYYSEGKWKMADPTLGSRFFKFLNFNRNDGRHLSYGEYEYLINTYSKMSNWAYTRSQERIGDIGYFRYVATTDSKNVSIYSTTEVNKGWDGRYLNTISVWVIITFLLCLFRNKIITPLNVKNAPKL